MTDTKASAQQTWESTKSATADGINVAAEKTAEIGDAAKKMSESAMETATDITNKTMETTKSTWKSIMAYLGLLKDEQGNLIGERNKAVEAVRPYAEKTVDLADDAVEASVEAGQRGLHRVVSYIRERRAARLARRAAMKGQSAASEGPREGSRGKRIIVFLLLLGAAAGGGYYAYRHIQNMEKKDETDANASESPKNRDLDVNVNGNGEASVKKSADEYAEY